MAEVQLDLLGFGQTTLQFFGGLDAASLIADAHEPRTCRAALDIALRKGGGVGETAMVEGVVALLTYSFFLAGLGHGFLENSVSLRMRAV